MERKIRLVGLGWTWGWGERKGVGERECDMNWMSRMGVVRSEIICRGMW
jgi:hypothetical protein